MATGTLPAASAATVLPPSTLAPATLGHLGRAAESLAEAVAAERSEEHTSELQSH